MRLILELRTISELLVLWEGKTMRELLFRPKTLREQQLLYVGVVLEEEATDFSSLAGGGEVMSRAVFGFSKPETRLAIPGVCGVQKYCVGVRVVSSDFRKTARRNIF